MRPAKSVRVKTGAMSKEETKTRQAAEDTLRGTDTTPEPPEHLTEEQREVFRFITDGLSESSILGRLDVFVLESTAVAVTRLRKISRLIDESDTLLYDTALMGTRAKYQSDLWRGCNELCLSPQARAKLGNLAAQAGKEREDPLLKALMADD